MNFADLRLEVSNKDQNPSIKFKGFKSWFNKSLPDRNLFLVKAGTNFSNQSVTLPMSIARNENYKLVNYGKDYSYYTDAQTNESLVYVKDRDNNKICFTDFNNSLGNSTYYGNFSCVVDANGVKSTTSATAAKYANIQFVRDHSSGSHKVYFRTSTGTILSEVFQIPADTQEITNFAYNAATGLITFNYKIVINEFRNLDTEYHHDQQFDYSYRGANTTNKTLEIRGSVSANVYNSVIMRKGFE
jgi:hypothetical protein